MKLLADRNIFYVHNLFGLNNQVKLCEGRLITTADVKCIDILIVRSVTKINRLLLQDSSVKFVGTTTSGIDHVDQDYLKKNRIKFAYAPGSNAIAVVEYVFSALFWLACRDQFFLRDKTIGIIGVGCIGNLLYQLLRELGVHVLLYDPYLSKIDLNKNWTSLDKLISDSDIVTLHTPLTYTGMYPTWHMINLDVLDALPNFSTLINTSRGPVVDNMALLKVLQCGKKINVVLDVWESEPDLLWELFSYIDIGTAHVAGNTVESKLRSIVQIYNVYCTYFNVSNTINVLDSLFFVIKNIKFSKLDEYLINRLIQSVYNIYTDHLVLKSCINQPNKFDVVRNRCIRREWSSLCLKTNYDYCIDILNKLGFNIIR